MDKKEKEILNGAIDKAFADFLEIYPNEIFKNNEGIAFYFKYKQKRLKESRNSKKCMFPNCSSKSVRHSHTLQKSGPLNMISEKNHVYQPDFSCQEDKVIMKKISVNSASTFPGYCRKHEEIFSTFEKKCKVENDKDIKLQLFRTVCRELQTSKVFLKIMMEEEKEYKKYQSERFKEVLEKYVRESNMWGKIRELEFRREDYSTVAMEGLIEQTKAKVEVFTDYFNALYKDIDNNGDNIYYKAVKVEYFIPVCLAGIYSYTVQKENEKGLFIFNILPQKDGTIITIATNDKYKRLIDEYINYYSQDGLLMLVAIESWMIYVTDHWFIKPSVWDEIPENRQEKILGDILDLKYGLYDQYKLSIFDKARKHMLNIIDRQGNWDKFNKKTKEFYINEKEKLENKESYDVFTFEDMLDQQAKDIYQKS